MSREPALLPRRVVRGLVPLLCALGIMLACPAPADAATITVTSTGEELTTNGQCTLVEALNNANNNTLSHPDCAAGQGGGIVDTIRFQIPTFSDFGCNPSTRVCTIVTSSPYTIVESLTIDGYTQTNTSPNTLEVGNNAVIRVRLIPANSSVPVGLSVEVNDVTIRGLAIGGYRDFGIHVESGANARIAGCFVGTDAAGTTAVPNGLAGIRVDGPSTNATIGGSSPADRNVISGHTGNIGISLQDTSHTLIQGNYIGLTANGLNALPNAIGVRVSNAPQTTIGGTASAARNVITGNTVAGIQLTADGSSLAGAAVVQGNYIGSDRSGLPFGSSNQTGIYVFSSQNTIGGTTPGDGNLIAFNTQQGILIGGGTGNRILGNRIRDNGFVLNTDGLGIDLAPVGITPNDPEDGDSGPNNRQNFPVLTGVGVRANTTVHGTLNSTPGRSFRIELFSSEFCEENGNGEGETFVGFLNVNTDGSGNAGFVGTFPLVAAGHQITATATDLTTNDTSEFSACRQAVQAGFNVSNISNPTTEANEGGAFDAQFTVSLTSPPATNVTIPIGVSDATEGRFVPGTPASLTFTPADATTPRTVLLFGVDDAQDDGNVPYTVVLGPASSTDPNYHGLDPADVAVTNIDDDNAAVQCNPRPRVSVSVTNVGNQQLRAVITVTANPGAQNEIQSIRWDALDTTTVLVDNSGPAQAGQTMVFAPLTQRVSFTITRLPGAQSGTVRLMVTDVCGEWPTFVGGGANAF